MKPVLFSALIAMAFSAPSKATVPVIDTAPRTVRDFFLYNQGHGNKHVVVRRQDNQTVLVRAILLDGEDMAAPVERPDETNGPCGVALEVSVDNGVTFHSVEVYPQVCERTNQSPFALVVYDKGGLLTTVDPD